MRKPILVLLGVVIILLLALDRIGVLIADQQIAKRVQNAQELPTRPGVSIKGFPFLTQVLSGHYGQMVVTVHNVTRNGLTVDRVRVSAHGISVPLGQVVSGNVKEVPVKRADATVTIGLANLNNYIAAQVPGNLLKVSAAGDKLKLTGTLPFPPSVSVSLQTRIDVASNSITLRPASVDALLATIPGGQAIRSMVMNFFTVKLPISQLPFGISLKQASVVKNAVVITASATGLTFRNPSG
jgi:LmeA-like phospholipid-binding